MSTIVMRRLGLLFILVLGLVLFPIGCAEQEDGKPVADGGSTSVEAGVPDDAIAIDDGDVSHRAADAAPDGASCDADPTCLPPTANAVTVTVAYGSVDNPITLNITDRKATSVAIPTPPSHGTATASGIGITYTPASGYAGSDSFTYTAANASGTSTPATVQVTVNPQPPSANPVSVVVAKNSTNNPVALDVTDGTPSSVAVASPPSHGAAAASGTSITYTPAADYVGSDSFTYSASNAGGTSTPATIAITVNPQPPIANPVSLTVVSNSANDSVPLDITGGTPASVAVPSGPSHGSVAISGVSITYTPTANYTGGDSFTYTATNAGGTSAPATVSITVAPAPPPPPIANAVTATVAWNSVSNAIPLDITGGTPTSVAAPTGPTHGSVSVSGTSIKYTPSAGYSGPDSFTYTATNAGGTSAPATVSLTVHPQPPITNAVTTTVAYGSTNNPITLNITGGTPTSVAVPTGPTHGTASASGTSITYTPTIGYSGPDSFTYTATNAGGTSTPATVSITVSAPPKPIANSVSATVAYGSMNNPITLNITGGTPTSVAVPTGPTHGTASASGTSIAYTPTIGYSGPDTFTYTATNAGGTSTPATVSITVGLPPPIANNVGATVAYGSMNNPITLNITGGTPISVAVSTGATHGTASASGTSITYTPAAGYAGPDSFTYTATNAGGTSAPATASITVSAPPKPIASSVSATVAYGSMNNPITLNITGGTPTSVAVSTGATYGIASASGTSIKYTPTAGYSGPDSFTYTATNAGGTSAPATVSITVGLQPPIANNVGATVAYGSTNNPITLNITGGTPNSVAVSTGPTHGIASASGTSIKYTPTAGYAGPDSFTYTATNVGGSSAPATVSITVSAPPKPIANNVGATVARNSTSNPITLNITGGVPTSVAVPTPPTHGSVSIAGTSITYTPTAGYSGADSFTYTATNAGGTSAPATASITVSP